MSDSNPAPPVTGLVLCDGTGHVFGPGGDLMPPKHDAQGAGFEHAMSHDHGAPPDVSGEGPVPTVMRAVAPGADGSRNLPFVTGTFAFAPVAVNGPHISGRGHAHVYVDAITVMRTCGPRVHLVPVPDAQSAQVTRNAGSHEVAGGGRYPGQGRGRIAARTGPRFRQAGMHPIRQYRSLPQPRTSAGRPSGAARCRRTNSAISAACATG